MDQILKQSVRSSMNSERREYFFHDIFQKTFVFSIETSRKTAALSHWVPRSRSVFDNAGTIIGNESLISDANPKMRSK